MRRKGTISTISKFNTYGKKVDIIIPEDYAFFGYEYKYTLIYLVIYSSRKLPSHQICLYSYTHFFNVCGEDRSGGHCYLMGVQ